MPITFLDEEEDIAPLATPAKRKITFLDEEEDITPLAPPTKRKITFLDEEDGIAPVTPQAARPAVTQPSPYKYDPARFRPRGLVAPKAEQEIGTLEGISNAAKNAFDSSRQALDIVGDVTPEEAQNIAKIEFDKQSRKLAPGYDEYQKAEGFDAVLAFAKNPIEVTSNIVAEGLAGSLPALGAGLAAGGVGAAIGAPTGIGAPIGFTAGQVAGTFAGSLATEYGSKILEEMQSEGVDLTKPESIQGFFENEEAVTKARDKAISRGIPVAAFDAISAGIGGKLGRVIGKQFLTKTGEAAAELGVQAGLGGAGAIAGPLAAGEPISGKEVFGEVIGEVGPGAAEIITGRMADRAARVKAEEEKKIKAAAQLSDNLEQNSAPLTAAAVKSTTATTIEQDKLAAQLEEQLDADEIASQVSGKIAPTITPAVTPAVPTAQPPITDATQEIIQPEGVRQEPQDRVEGETPAETIARNRLLGAARGQEEGQVAPTPTAEEPLAAPTAPAIPEAITRAIEERKPISAPFALQYGVDLPRGWRYEDDFFVPPAGPAPAAEVPAVTPTPAAEVAAPEPIISEIPPTSELVGAEPTQPTIREVPEISPIVGAEPAAIVEQEPVAPAEPKGTRVAAAAYIAPDGTEYTGPSHLAAMEQAKNEGKITQAEIDAKQAPESRETPQFGYKTDADPFVTRDQAEGIARQSGQLLVEKPATGQLHSNEVALDEFPKEAAVAPAPAEEVTPTVSEVSNIPKLESEYNAAKAKLDALGPEPIKPSSEARFFGARGRAGAPTELVAKYDADVKAYNSYRRKYSSAKKAEVEAANNLFYARREAAPVPTPATAPVTTPPVTEAVTPAPEAAPTPAGISVGNRIKLGKSPQTYTIEEVIPQSATERELGEQYYSVKNERTGETQVVEARDLKQVKGKGARKLFAGERAEIPQFMRDSLDAARAMAAAGKTTEEIRAVTGWFPGMDGKMRWEIPDQDARIVTPQTKNRLQRATEWLHSQGVPMNLDVGSPKVDQELRKKSLEYADQNIPQFNLSDILQHESLYAAYPEARNIPIKFQTSTEYAGMYEPASGVISIGEGVITDKSDAKLSTLLHEIQHWIQNKEGFAAGTNLRTEASKLKADKRVTDAQYELQKAWAAVPPLERVDVKNTLRDSYGSGNLSTLGLDKNDESSLEKLDLWEVARTGYLLEPNVEKALRNLFEVRDAVYAGSEKDSARQAYLRNAGEIESRDVEARRALNPEQRKAVAPYASQNIATEDAIIIQESEGAASEVSPTPEGILITPPDQQYTFNEVFDVAYDMFGGEIPEGFTIVNDSKDKDFEFKAAYIPESGEIIVNLAYLNKNDDIRDAITHELGHYIYGDPEFRAAFDQFIASLSPEARAELDAYVETAYNKETGEIRLEEKMVRAFVDQFINEEQAPMWRTMLDAIKRFLNKLGFKFNISDRDAISVFTAALNRYKAGEAISREGGARKIIDDLTAMDAEYLAAVERGDMETAQRMVDEAAKRAGYNVGPVYHGTTKEFSEFKKVSEFNRLDGFYFGTKKDAEFFAKQIPEGRIISAYLSINNPASMGDMQEAEKTVSFNSTNRGYKVKQNLINQGFDGAVLYFEDSKETEYVAFNPEQIKSADPVTYDDAGDVIPLSQRFRPTSPDIRRMAAEPAPKRRKEQVGGAEREETRYITTPKGILSMNTDVLREKFFDGTSVSPEKTTQAWGYISRLLDIKSGNANELAGEINDTVDADLLAKREAAIAAGEQVDPEEDVSKRIGAAMFSVELMNYAGRLAEQGDTRMLKFMIRNVNSMPTDKYAGDISDAARALRTRLEYDVSGFSAYTTEQKAKVDRTAAVMFGTNKPSKEQSDAVKDAIDESEKTELGNAGEVAGEVEKVEKRTKRKITDKIEKIIGKGSLKGMIQAVKDTPLEKQQERGWIEKVVNDFLINAGLSPEAASTASKLYESLIAERFAAAKQKAFEDNLKKAAPWKNYAARNSRLAKDALNKVQAAIRTGVLDPEKNTESIIAAESGWSGFTKDQYQRIVQLDSIINDPKQDDVTRREAMADLNKVISDAKLPVRFKDALGAYYVGNALMGIPTLTVNIASPIGFTVRNLMTDVSKFAFTDPARIPVAFETFMESMRSWYDQTSYAFKNQIYLNDVVEYLQGQNVLRELFDKGKKQWSEGKYAEGFVNMAVGMTQITGRVLSSLDQGAISMLENQNITRYALEALANTKGKVPKDKLKEFANMVIDTRRKTIAENIANGMSRDRAGVLADLAVKSEVISALAQYDVNPMNVLDASINDALQSVGRNKTLTIKGIEQSQKNISDEGFMSYWPIKLLEMVSAGAGREGSSMQIFAKMLYGFALVPARVFHNVAWFSPYGFIRLGVDKYKKNKGEDSPYAMSLQTEAQYKQRLTDAIAGSVAMLGLAALSSASTDEDEDKKFKIVITGNGPSATTDKQYFDSWMKKWKPYSVHIVVNGNIIPINIGRGGEALFFPIMLAGALDDWKIKQKQNLTKKEPEDLSAIAQMLGSSFFALAQRGPYAAFTKPLFDASKDGRVTEELASQAGFFGKTFIPVLGSSLARNISDLFNDPVDRSSIEGAIYANTPVVGPWLGTKALNALGQPIRADDWGDKLFKLGVPVVFSFPKETPMNELNELILKQGSGPTIPTRANAQKRFGDILTDKEFETYVREYGRVMSDKMFKSRTKLANMKPADYDDELEKYARGYSIDGIKIKGASDSAVLAVKRMRQ